MKPGFIKDITELTLESNDLRLGQLMDTPEWEDIKNIIEVMLQWALVEMMDDDPTEMLITKGRCFVLREIGQQIESQVKAITEANFSLELGDEDYDQLDNDEV